ncbi:MAG: ABC transporter permease [archaeon]
MTADILLLAWMYVKKAYPKKVYVIGLMSFPMVLALLTVFGLGKAVNLTAQVSMLFLLPGLIGVYVVRRTQFLFFFMAPDVNKTIRLWLTFPFSRKKLILGIFLGEAAVQLLGVGVFLLILCFYLKTMPLLSILCIIGYSMLLSFCFFGASLVLIMLMRSKEMVFIISAFAYPILYALSGAFYPLEHLPLLMRTAALLNPVTYAVDGMRYFMIGTSETNLLVGLAILIFTSAALFAAGVFLLEKRDYYSKF